MRIIKCDLCGAEKEGEDRGKQEQWELNRDYLNLKIDNLQIS